MPLRISLEDVAGKVEGTVMALLEIRHLCGDLGFLDLYVTARNERSPLTTSEYLMSVLLPVEVFSYSPAHRDRFSMPRLLQEAYKRFSADIAPLVEDDIGYIATEFLGRDFDAKEPPPNIGRPYTYRKNAHRKDQPRNGPLGRVSNRAGWVSGRSGAGGRVLPAVSVVATGQSGGGRREA